MDYRPFVARQEESMPTIDDRTWESAERFDLNAAPVGTQVTFRGSHPDAHYLLEIVEEEGVRMVKFWYLRGWGGGCFLG